MASKTLLELRKLAQSKGTGGEEKQGGSSAAQKLRELAQQAGGSTKAASGTSASEKLRALASSAEAAPKASFSGDVPQVDEQRREQLSRKLRASEEQFRTAETTLQRAEDALQSSEKAMQGYLASWQSAPTEANRAAYEQAYGAYQEALRGYEQMYDRYSQLFSEYELDAVRYDRFMNQNKAAYDSWRSGIRDAETVRSELEAVSDALKESKAVDKQAAIDAYEKEVRNKPMWEWLLEAAQASQNRNGPTLSSDSYTVVDSQQTQELMQKQEQLQKELEWSEYLRWADLRGNADFAEKSKYVSTANGSKPVQTTLYTLSGNPYIRYTTTGFDDLTYDYINRNTTARGIGEVNDIGDNAALAGTDKGYLQHMTDDEIAIFNYMYATQGADAAYEYVAYLTKDLNARQRMAQEAQWTRYAGEHPVKSSVFSALMAPAKGLSYVGQAADYLDDGKIDQNAGYNKFSYIPSAIREEVSSKWGPVGSFAYNTGMSMADFLTNTVAGMGNSALTMTLMGSGAAADTVLEAKDRGLSDNQAFALGTVAGIAEGVTEKYSLEKLFDTDLLTDSMWKYVVVNAFTEGSEEVASGTINWLADIIVSQDQSQWAQAIRAYEAKGKTASEAFALALKDQALSLGADFLGGMISGGLLGGGGAAIHGVSSTQAGSKVDGMQLAELILEAAVSDPKSSAHQVYLRLNQKLEKGQSLTNYDKGLLQQAVEQTREADGRKANSQAPANLEEDEDIEIIEAVERDQQDDSRPAVMPSENVSENVDSVEKEEATEPQDDFWAGVGKQIKDNLGLTEAEGGKKLTLKERVWKIIRKIRGDPAARPDGTETARQALKEAARMLERGELSQEQFDAVADYLGEYLIDETGMVREEAFPEAGSIRAERKAESDALAKAGVDIRNQEQDPVVWEERPMTAQEAFQQEVNDQIARNMGIEKPAQAKAAASVDGQAEYDGGMRNGEGDNVSDGGQGRDADPGTREQAGSVSGRTAGQGPAAVAHAKARVQRQNAAGDLLRKGLIREQSSRELGISSGTDSRKTLVLPEEYYDDALESLSRRIEEETGCRAVFTIGGIEIRGADGKPVTVRGVFSDKQIVLQADHKIDTERLADHEIFHHAESEMPGLTEYIRQQLPEEKFDRVFDRYIKKLWPVYGCEETASADEKDEAYARIREEVLADAYAGINAFGAGATRFADDVQRIAGEMGMGTGRQENGVRKTNGPPGERYSFAGDNAATFDSVNMTEQDAEDGRKVADFIEQVNRMIDKSRRSKRKHKIGTVSQNHAELINSIMRQISPGFDAYGYELWIDGTCAVHIEDRHGVHGLQDKTMATEEAKSLIPWAAQNATRGNFLYDKHGAIKMSDRYRDRSGKRAPEICIEKVINNDTVCVSECVPDSSAGKIWITSAYIKKGSKGQVLNMEEDASLQLTPEAPVDGNATTDILANEAGRVKESFSVDEATSSVGELQVELNHLQSERRAMLEASPAYKTANEKLKYANTFREKVEARKVLNAAAAEIDTAEIDQRIAELHDEISELRNRDVRQHREDQEKYSGTKTKGYSVLPDFRIKTMDREYMNAVRAGDMDAVSKLVEEAAEAAMRASVVRDGNGKLLKVYHHTGNTFTVFDRNMARTGNEMDGFFFAPDPDATDEYGPNMITAYLNITNLAMDPQLDRMFNDSGTLLREKLAYQGFDGVARTENGKIYEYMAFDPEQVKSAEPIVYDDRGKVIPLSKRFDFKNPDIRYSPDDAAAEDFFEDVEAASEKPKFDRSKAPWKVRSGLKRIESGLLRNIQGALGAHRLVDRPYLRDAVQELADEYMNTGTVSQETMDRLFKDSYERGVLIDRELHDQYSEVKKHLNTRAVTISEQDKADIADYNDFRRRTKGCLRIVNEGGLPVDTFYDELRDMAPGLFPEDITHPADQLRKLYEVAKSLQISERHLSEFYGSEPGDFRKWARHEFETAVWQNITGLAEVRRYLEDKQAQKEAEEKAPSTEEEAEELWKRIKEARKAYEKAMARNFLTTEDEIIVGRLLRGEIQPEHLDPQAKGTRGILAVYEGKKEYCRLMDLIGEYRRSVKGQLRKDADGYLQTAGEWKDKGGGLLYSRETMERNIEDIVKDPKLAKKINAHFFEPIRDAEAAATRMKNDYRKRVRDLKLSRKVAKGNLVSEAHAVQLYGEAVDNIRMLEATRGRVQMRDGKTLEEWRAVVDNLWLENPGLNKAKIENAVQEFRKIYDELFQQMNKVRVRWGYEPVNYRNGYFPHFQPGDGDGILQRFGKALGIDTQVVALPTTINGLTHTFKPGIQWFGNAQERLGFNTAYDAVEGFDKYIEGIASVIHQTENIQKLRALAAQVRYRTTEEGIQKQVDEIYARDDLDDSDKDRRIRELYENGKFSLGIFVVELDEYTNLLANKKSKFDRGVEAALGRRFYVCMKWLESRVGANMIAGNITSALTNFIPLTQASAQIGYGHLLKGMWQTLAAYRSGDGMVGMSSFLTNRKGSDPLVQTWGQKVSGWISTPMELIDGFVSGSIVRAAYEQNLKRGMPESEAAHEADIFAARVMAERSKGGMPTLFASSNPLVKLVTQFQLEVNNQFSEVFKDLPRAYRDKAVAALVVAFLRYFLGAWIFNNLYEKLIGRRSALDPIDIVLDLGGDLFGENAVGIGEAGLNFAASIGEQLPFASVFGLVFPDFDAGRIPLSSALPNITNLVNAATNSEWDPDYRFGKAMEEIQKPITYLALPFGGNQLSKLWKGTEAYIKGGSYSMDKEGNDLLQYPVHNDESGDFWKLIQSMLLGKSALPQAQEWVEDGFDSLNAKQTAVYQDMLDAGVSSRDAYGLIDDLRAAEDKLEALQDADVSGEAKAVAFYGLLASDKERELMDALDDIGADPGTVTSTLVYLHDADGLKGMEKYSIQADVLNGSALTEEEKQLVIGSWLGTEEVSEEGNLTQYGKFLAAMKSGISTYEYLQHRRKGGSVDDLLEYTDKGMDAKDASELSLALDALEPEEGEERVTNLQRWRVCVDFPGDAENHLTSLSGVMTDSQFEKVERAWEFGVKPELYVYYHELRESFDANGNGSYSQAEVKATIDAMGDELTNDQKAALWQIVTGSKKAANNPYNAEIGQKVLDSSQK